MSKLATGRWALLFLLSILVGTLMPAAWRDAIFALFPHGVVVQKAGHIIAFAGAAFFTVQAAFWRARMWHVFGMGLLVAVATEGMQVLVRGRSPSARDLLLDIAGTCIGLFLARSISRESKG